MKTLLSVSLALALCAAGVGRAAEPDVAHQGHHPSPATVESPAPALPVVEHGAPAATLAPVEKGKVDAQLGRMHEMHARMAKAATPAERHALMAEHMQVMQDGMEMMQAMSAMPMGAGGAAGGMPPGAMAGGDASAGKHDHMGPDMKAHHDAMHQRMRMMEAMMQMMMDRLADPASHR
jgi:hypothetical protein